MTPQLLPVQLFVLRVHEYLRVAGVLDHKCSLRGRQHAKITLTLLNRWTHLTLREVVCVCVCVCVCVRERERERERERKVK